MFRYLGIDTSNYTTSVALYGDQFCEILHSKKLLKVKSGERGLRQSNAVFQHINELPNSLQKVFENSSTSISAIGVSSRPRDEENSYMPCFVAGISIAKCIAIVNRVPCYEFSHQAGHIAAALFSAKKLELLKEKFIAFHVSGGTTEAVLVEPDPKKIIKTTCIAKSLDLKAGQLIDRVGVKLGFDFPCGKYVDELSKLSKKNFKINPCFKKLDCCLSGAENICSDMIEKGYSNADVCKFCIEFINETLSLMCSKIINQYGQIPILFAGGVTSNSKIRTQLSEKFGATFASAEFSSDNAAGIAILTSEVHNAQI